MVIYIKRIKTINTPLRYQDHHSVLNIQYTPSFAVVQ